MTNKDELYRTLVDLIPDALVVIQDGRHQVVNSAFTEMFGYTSHDVDQGLTFLVLVQDQDKELVRRRYESRLAEEEVPRTYRIDLIAKDGSIKACETSTTLIEYARRPAHLVLVRDVSERVQAEDALVESESEYRELFENLPEGAYQTTPDGTIIKANPALVKMLGYESEEDLCTSVNVGKLYSKPDERVDLTRELEKEGELRNVEILLKRKGGGRITALENARVVRDSSGKVLHYEGLLTDITDRKRAERKLQESEDRFRSITENAVDSIFIKDIDRRYTFVNRALRDLLGLSEEEILGKTPKEVFGPEQEQVITEVDDRTFSGETVDETEGLVIGDKKYFFNTIQTPLSMEDGKVSSIMGIVRDITERMRAEEALRESEERFRTIVTNSTPIVFMFDREGKMLLSEGKMLAALGLKPGEVVGQSVFDLYREFPEVIRSLRKALEGEMFEGVIELGGLFFEVFFSPKKDSQGNVVGVVGMGLDITEHKRSTERLRKTTETLEIERQELTEKNIALEHILEHIESRKQSHRQQVCSDMEDAIIPAVERLKKKVGSEFIDEFGDLEAAIAMVLSKDIDEHVARYSKLTSRESEICDMIKAGMSSKQIADALSLSLTTVHKHREHAREKLEITGTTLSLSTYLRSR